MIKSLMGTTALATICIAGGTMLTASDAMAQSRLCPATATGTGNISNAMCNAIGVPVPFTATVNLDVQEIVQSNPNAQNGSVNGVGGNQGGPGNHVIGFFQDAWSRWHFDGATEAGHIGFNFNLLLNSNQQPSVRARDSAGAGNTLSVNNTFNHSPSQIDRDYFYWKTPAWGEFQMGATGTSSTATFPYTPTGWGPPGPAAAGDGPDGGIFTQAVTDPTAFNLDANNSTLGADPYSAKSAMKIRWISPNFGGSDPDHGFRFDIALAPDGRGHDEGNFHTDSEGASANNDTGESTPPSQLLQKQMFITNMALTWDDTLGSKDWEYSAGLGWNHGFSKKGIATDVATGGPVAPGGTIGAYNGFGQVPSNGQADSSHKANADINVFAVGAQVVWNGALTIGGTFTYAGKSFYPANTPVFDQFGGTHTTMPAWGASGGVEYDWDRYSAGAYYQYTVSQGDAADWGYVQMQYLGMGLGVHILKGLKWFNDVTFYKARNNHSPVVIFGGACGGAGQQTRNFGGGSVTGDTSCRRESDGVVLATGLSLDF